MKLTFDKEEGSSFGSEVYAEYLSVIKLYSQRIIKKYLYQKQIKYYDGNDIHNQTKSKKDF